MQTGLRAELRIELFVEHAAHRAPGVQHQVLAHQARAVGQALRKPGRGGVEQQAWRADAVAGQHHDLGALQLLAALAIVVDDAGGHVVVVHQDLAHAAVRLQLHAGAQRQRPVGDVDTSLGALRAARLAGAQVQARGAALVLARGNRDLRGPPVPAQPVEAAGHRLAQTAQRHRRQRRLVRRIGRITCQAGHAHVVVVDGVEGLECLVARSASLPPPRPGCGP